MKNIFIEATLDKYISEYKRVFDDTLCFIDKSYVYDWVKD